MASPLCSLQVIQSERLAEESLDVIRQVGFRIGTAINGLHSVGVVHGDIKPRNVVREGANDWKLIDLDMSFNWGRRVRKHDSKSAIVFTGDTPPSPTPSEIEDTPKHFNLATRDKIRASTAYSCPELVRYVEHPPARHDPTGGQEAVEDALNTACRIDIWSFGVLMYEVATGLTLFEHQYDRATAAGVDQLLRWGGLTDAHIATLEEHYGAKVCCCL
jgi:serine/threonine protein kinase